MTKLNLGVFEVSMPLIKETPNEVAELLGALKFVPTRVELLFNKMAFRYEGLSPRFPEIQLGEAIPEYEIKVTRDADGCFGLVEVIIK